MNKNNKQLAIFFLADEKRLRFLEPMLPVFISQLNKSMHSLLESQENSDNGSFSNLIHKIKGSVLTYGAQPIYDEITAIEDKMSLTKNVSSTNLSKLISVVNFLNEIHPLDDALDSK